VRTHATRVAMMTCGVLPGPYRVPGAYRAICHFRLTNKTPAATYRAPGRFETTFVRERLVDAIAHQLRLDPIHVRRRNAVTVDEMPFKRPLEALGEEIHFDTGDYHKLLDTTLAYVEWTKLNAELAARRENGEMVGIGLAMFVEKAGLGPADGVRIQVDTSGAVEVITGGASIGQGFETVMAQVAAEALGTDYKRMRVIHGQTDRIENGIGAQRFARHRDDGVGDACCRAEGSREGAERWSGAAAVAGRDARHRRWRGGDRRPQERALSVARQDCRGARAELETAW